MAQRMMCPLQELCVANRGIHDGIPMVVRANPGHPGNHMATRTTTRCARAYRRPEQRQPTTPQIPTKTTIPEPEPNPRRMRIEGTDLERIGCTPGCARPGFWSRTCTAPTRKRAIACASPWARRRKTPPWWPRWRACSTAARRAADGAGGARVYAILAGAWRQGLRPCAPCSPGRNESVTLSKTAQKPCSRRRQAVRRAGSTVRADQPSEYRTGRNA